MIDLVLNKESKLVYKNKETGEFELKTSYSQLEMFENCHLNWYRTYYLGEREPVRTEALDYGNAIHTLIEEFIKSKFTLNPLALINIYIQEITVKNIVFDTDESRNQCHLDMMGLITRMYRLKSLTPKELAYFEQAFFFGESQVEVPFRVEYDLPIPLNITFFDKEEKEHTQLFEKIIMSGFIDHLVEYEGAIILNDHKSGKTLFKDQKLKENLQFPVYAMWVYRKYGRLPNNCFYNFTRTGEFQGVMTDWPRMRGAIAKMDDLLSKMFSGTMVYPHNPTPLCYWCQFGKYNDKTCQFSSNYKPKPK